MALFTNLDLSLVASYAVTGIDSLPMMAIPFFMLSGVIMSVGGLARRLIDVAASVVGWMTGGLGAVVSLSSMFFGAISGSSMATVSCIGSIMVPEMKKKGYDMGYSAVFTACAGTIGAVIPPSIPLVVFGVCTSTSVGDLFVGGILPGILIGLGLIVSNFIVCKKREATAAWNAKAEGKFSARFGRPSGHCLRQSSFWAEFYGGYFTPTEASVVAVVYSAIVALLIYREVTLKDLYRAVVSTAVTNGITTFLLGLSTGFAALLSFEQVTTALTNALTTFTDNKIVFLMIVNAALLVIGCFIDNANQG